MVGRLETALSQVGAPGGQAQPDRTTITHMGKNSGLSLNKTTPRLFINLKPFLTSGRLRIPSAVFPLFRFVTRFFFSFKIYLFNKRNTIFHATTTRTNTRVLLKFFTQFSSQPQQWTVVQVRT